MPAKGFRHSEESKMKMSVTRTGRPGRKHTAEEDSKASLRMMGYNPSAEVRLKMRLAKLGKKAYEYTCPACGRAEPEIKLSRDHIVPISKGGSDYIINIQPLCRSCNCKKHNKQIFYDTALCGS